MKRNKGITLIALVITILFSYDYGRKCSNGNKFLLTEKLLNYEKLEIIKK